MKKLLRSLFYLIQISAFGQTPIFQQAVATVEPFPNGDKEITLIFDLAFSKDNRKTGLLNKTSDIYLWSGAGTNENGDAFEYQPAGQTTWGVPFEKGKMTSLGNDKWSIKMVPRAYFGVPADRTIKKLGLLLKNGNGSSQTEDFILKMYDGKLNIALLAPAQKNFFVNQNANVLVRIKSSANAKLSLSIANKLLYSQNNADSLNYTWNVAGDAGTNQTLLIKAETATENVTDSLNVLIRPNVNVAELPTGLQDGINYINENKVILSFYAPLKNFVYVLGDFNNWQASPKYLMNRTPDGSRYWLEIDALEGGKEYAYQYWIDGGLNVADPNADKFLDPNNDKYISASTYPNLKAYPEKTKFIVSILQTNQAKYAWKVTSFNRIDASKLNVYELLVRDFSADKRYKTVADSIQYFKRLGINAIELMPIMEFTGNDSWGYNPTFYFAPDKAYGTKNDLKYLIDRCHENGIAIILDMVLNQADYENPYVKMYWDGSQPSKESPFFNQQATHPYSVFFDFNHESKSTQNMVDKICEYWIKEYKFDGFRFDLSKGFTQKNANGDVNAWGQYDASRVAIWKRIYDKIKTYDASAYVILEHFADNTEERELSNYGMMFWGNSNYDYRRTANGFAQNIDWISYQKRNWAKPNLIGYMESHDEERQLWDLIQNGKKKFALDEALERAKMATALFLTVPGPKMIWQFGEFGYDVSIDANGRTGQKPLRWEYLKEANRLKLWKVYQALLQARATQGVFQAQNFSLDVAGLVKRMELNFATDKAYIIANTDINAVDISANFPATGKWYDFFTGESLDVTDTKAIIRLQAGEFHIYSTNKMPTPEPNLVPWVNPAFSALLANEENQKNVLNVYPNPVNDEITINFWAEKIGKTDLILSDLSGRNILQKSINVEQIGANQTKLTTHGFNKGIYLIKVGGETKKIIVP